ncbi:M14 family metallopeptidase [Thermodesulfobacteriota bacterium]
MMLRTLTIFVVMMVCGFGWGVCSQDEQPGTEKTIYFSADYEEARQKFLEASSAAGASLDSFKNPYPGPEGEALYTDVALLGPSDASAILVLSSGTHGVEGFVGSAIQTGLLLEGIGTHLKPGVSIVLIHAINPYGFAYLRRFNEDNIDLNRNFVDHSLPYPANHGYEELADVISPESISFRANVKAIFRLLGYALKNGKTELKKALSCGQYTDPQGIIYGGQKEAWSNKTIRAIAKRYFSHAKRVVMVDFHTGLGPFGNAEVILNLRKESPAYKRAVEWWGDIVKTTANEESVSVHLKTTLKLAIPKMIPHVEVTAVSLEFGTLSSITVFWSLRAESWLYHHGGDDHPKAEKIKQNLLRAFYPDSEGWKHQVWEQGRDIVKQALRQLP